MGEVPFRIPLRCYPVRLHARKDQAGDRRLVTVAADEQTLLRPGGHRHHGSLHRQRAAAGREECRFSAHRLGHQIFGLRQEATSRHAVVETTGGHHVVAERVLAEYGERAFVGPSTLTMARWAEAVALAAVIVRQGVE